MKLSNNKFDISVKFLILPFCVLLAFSTLHLSGFIKKADAKSTVVSATLNSVVGITTTDRVEIDITPSMEGTFKSASGNAIVSTNSPAGYRLYMSSVDEETALVSEQTTSLIPSAFTGSVTSSSMAKDSWGYSIDNTNYKAIPKLSNSTEIRNVEEKVTSDNNTTTVYFGAKISTATQSGIYTKTILFSAIANDPKPIVTMQTFKSDMISNIGDSMTLKDERDGKTYTIAKLADGNVWMTQNLAIENMTLTPADSDVTSDYVLPASNLAGFTRAYDQSNVYLDSAYGGYYSWTAATAGTGTTLTTAEQNAPYSICPKGWKLPTKDQNVALAAAYSNSAASLLANPVQLQLSGGVRNGSVDGQGTAGRYWSSTAYNANDAYRLYLNSSAVNPGLYYDSKYNGFAVRCIAQ